MNKQNKTKQNPATENQSLETNHQQPRSKYQNIDKFNLNFT